MLEALPVPRPAVLVAVFLIASALIALLLWFAMRRQTPAERERRRRLQVNAAGRITSGAVIDVQKTDAPEGPRGEHLIHYSYSIGGVEYSASQDVSALLDLIGMDPSRIPGAVTVKYHARNPSNSIVICEDWSGLRAQPRG